MHDVEGRLGVLAQDPLAPPVLEELGGAGVAVSARGVARLLAIELQAHDVVGAGLVEPVLELGADHVVGRRHHLGEGADAGHLVPDASERADVGHGV